MSINNFLGFVSAFVAGRTDIQTSRYTLKLSTKGIKMNDGYNWAKHAARSNYGRGIP